ncbi:SLBB domain-containing protein [Mucilaginibacter sp. RS28]|uniref:SLBB domain-containing protein n=1 Tax=Mucilaginibacter straminoryzae TaxID=2932774 RepID=A0A9X1X215_9SPHI|nr:SLBB domain-containing protein [Mucilaginibacter straminoryzae]MCJ8209802.1 SLBB domain-containing protein [Mucilaginibacter straminoryzae]
MRFSKLLLYFLFIFLVAAQSSNGQSSISLNNIQNIKVSELSDEQVTQVWKKLQDSGIPEDQAYKLMEQKGLPAGEVQALKDRFTLLGLNKKGSLKTTSKSEKEKIDFSRDADTSVSRPAPTLKTSPTAQNATKLPVFGMDFFSQRTVKFEPNFNAATPKSYVIGPGDELILLVTGLNESSVRSKVTPEGNLQIPYAGIVYVNGYTIEQATAAIRSKMTKIYPGLRNGQTQLNVTLGNTRSIRITIVGEAQTPGTYTLSSLSTVFNALYNSGGPTANGSLRYIELIRNNRVYKTIDFYSFLQYGLMEGNIRLEDQDVLRIPVYRKRVSILGEVKKPAIYELKDGEQLDDLIKYAGGFTDLAYKGIAKVEQINDLERDVKDVPVNLFGNFVPRNGDVVTIGAITNRYANRIVLEGAVYRPGPYELTAGLTLSGLLNLAKGLKPEAYTNRGYIKRTLPDLQKQFISFNPLEIAAGRNDVPLMREDTVVIQEKSTFIAEQTVTVNGHVRTPSKFVYRKGMTLADVIAMAGGFDERAAVHHVEVSRIIKNEQDSVANQLVKTFTVDMTEGSADNVLLEPMDYVYVQRLVNYHTLGNVSVRGEVLFPGDYPVQRRDETAQEFLKRAGGLTPYGSLPNAQVFRNGVRVNLDLTNESTDPKIRETMILLAGDSIFIPRQNVFVEVTGAVNNPQLVNYDGGRFKYYINAAGGVTSHARLKGAYIKYPDGLNRPVRRFLVFRVYPKVKPGSKIIVPEKDPEVKFRLGVGDFASIASALTALIGLIAILKK